MSTPTSPHKASSRAMRSLSQEERVSQNLDSIRSVMRVTNYLIDGINLKGPIKSPSVTPYVSKTLKSPLYQKDQILTPTNYHQTASAATAQPQHTRLRFRDSPDAKEPIPEFNLHSDDSDQPTSDAVTNTSTTTNSQGTQTPPAKAQLLKDQKTDTADNTKIEATQTNHLTNSSQQDQKSGDVSVDNSKDFFDAVADKDISIVCPRAFSNLGQLEVAPIIEDPPCSNGSILWINIRQYLFILSQKIGRPATLDDIPESEFELFESFNWVWPIGCWTLGQIGVQHDKTDPFLVDAFNRALPDWTTEDIIGSPFSILSYEANSDIGGKQALLSFKRRLNSHGTRLLLDFVANHSARDEAHGPLYLENAYGNKKYTDTAQFNFSNPDLIKHHVENLRKITTVADGVCCVSAYLAQSKNFAEIWGQMPVTEFWQAVIASVPSFYIGEGRRDLYDLGFNAAVPEMPPFDSITKLAELGRSRNASVKDAYNSFQPGMKFFGYDQINGYGGYNNLHLRRIEKGEQNKDLALFYQRLIKAVSHDAVRYGTFTRIETGNDKIVGLKYFTKTDKVLICVNDNPETEIGTVICEDAEGNGEKDVIDILSETTYTRKVEEMRTKGLGLIIWEHLAQVFVY